MKGTKMARIAFAAALPLALFLLMRGTAAAQSAELKGVINLRSGATMTVQSADAGNVVVVLTPPRMSKKLKGGSICGRSRWE